jgi:ring-1,2-phenylacetyl-CoA epoxidase subunit PaaD
VTRLRSRYVSHVWAWLDGVMDPELPAVSITDLGIVRDVTWDADELVVGLTPTYSGCPATEVIERDVLAALHSRGVERARVERRLAPPWTTDWITSRGRERLQRHGIVPPVSTIANGPVVLSPANVVGPRCPRCGAPEVTELSRFGSTPCKALYRCDACREPFDYVKPH